MYASPNNRCSNRPYQTLTDKFSSEKGNMATHKVSRCSKCVEFYFDLLESGHCSQYVTRLRTIRSRLLERVRDFSVLKNVGTVSGTHPASSSTDIRVFSPELKRSGYKPNYVRPCNVEIKNSGIIIPIQTSACVSS
jgi:hypothetical protein